MTIPPPEEPSKISFKRPEEPGTKKKIEPKISLKKTAKSEDFFSFAKENTKETVAYIFLVVGFLLLFFEPLYGGTILGVLFGLYFSPEFLAFWRNANEWIEKWGMVKTLVIAGVLLSLFVASLGSAVIFIVTALTVFLKKTFVAEEVIITKTDHEE